MRKIINAVIEKYKKHFENSAVELNRDLFSEQLDYEADKLFYVVILSLFAMLFYMQQDLVIHQFSVFSVVLRIGMCVVSAAAILLKWNGTRRGRTNARLLLMAVMAYHCSMIALLAGTAGESASPYISGFAFVMMIFIIYPFTLKFKVVTYIVTIAVFFAAGLITGLEFTKPDVRYSLNDLFASFGLCVLFSYTMNSIRLKAWEQRKEIKNMLNRNEVNLVTISRLAEEANAASRAKTNFLAKMSHEIRTPMNAILGITEIQLWNQELSAEIKEAFGKVYESGTLLLNIINDILDLSKIETGKMEIMPVVYDIPSLINDAVQLNLLSYDGKPIEFYIDVDENTPLNLLGDELRIKQILSNVLSNAFKYTDKGEVRLSVRCEAQSAEPDVRMIFKVTDTGQGMTREQIDKLFDEYTRFNMEANRTTVGTGLGMSITKRLLDLMNGEIDVTSEVDKGSSFTVRIPQKRVNSHVCGNEITDKLSNFSFKSAEFTKKSRVLREYMPYGSVLVVDDVASNLYVTRGMLLPYGLRVETASSGFEAVEKIKNGDAYDIIFMDHMMPKMDGIEAAIMIRGLGYAKAIVALTANAVVGQSEKFLKNGFDGFISKPIDSRELNAALNEFIRNKKPPEVVKAARREQRAQYGRENELSAPSAVKNAAASELEELFMLDAENALRILDELNARISNLSDTDINSYEITVHGMKSALANIGETELSKTAATLERAANERDMAAINAQTSAFIKALRETLGKFKPI